MKNSNTQQEFIIIIKNKESPNWNSFLTCRLHILKYLSVLAIQGLDFCGTLLNFVLLNNVPAIMRRVVCYKQWSAWWRISLISMKAIVLTRQYDFHEPVNCLKITIEIQPREIKPCSLVWRFSYSYTIYLALHVSISSFIIYIILFLISIRNSLVSIYVIQYYKNVSNFYCFYYWVERRVAVHHFVMIYDF